MGYPDIENNHPFNFEPLFLADEEGRPLFVPVIKATYTISADGRLSLAKEQNPVNLEGVYWGDPDSSSYKYEPEIAFFKPATDIILIGHAYAPNPGINEINVLLRVGPIEKSVVVTGDRYWVKSLGVVSVTRPKPFERIPLIAERAFGGWDRSHPDIARHLFEARNPVGLGFRARNGRFEEGLRLPNLEYPSRRIKHYRETPPPAIFGYLSPHWQPRAGFAGTYDQSWQKSRMPLLPKDFDRRFFCSAPPDQIAPGYLNGSESVTLVNASPGGRLGFSLPGIAAPECTVQLRGALEKILRPQLDTVIINTDVMCLFLIWRSFLALSRGFEDVVSIQVNAS